MLPELKQPDRLLAKSVDSSWKGSYTLVGHTADVVNAVTTLVDVLGSRLISQFNLNCDLTKLRATVRLAAYLHDWGKANNQFQDMVRGKRHPLNQPQMVRHEAISVLLALEFRDWLDQEDSDFFTAVVAAGGHHLKLGGKAGKIAPDLFEIRSSGDDRIDLYLAPQYFKDMIVYGIKKIGLPKLPQSLKAPKCWTEREIKDLRLKAENTFFEEWQPDVSFVAVVKSLLVAGDAIGSASAKVTINIYEWIQQELSRTLTESDLQNVIDARQKCHSLYPFQIELNEKSTRVTMARAGCGTGKTLGAYNWAKKHAIGRKLFFCYPTTGTSTEGFLDYVRDEVESVLLHSRADVDLELELTQTGEEEDNGGEIIQDETTGKLIQSFEDEIAKKLESFKAWGSKVSVCTVDTVLGLLQCNRRPMYCFPAIAQAAFVFDEVHCYDDALFGALLRFLELVKAPILLMSASFLPAQVEAIQKAVGERVEIIKGPKDLEELPRYRFDQVDVPDWERVKEELTRIYELPNGEKVCGKVLWVCNQVNTAIAIYEHAKSLGLNALLYHSRYRYEDRKDRHRDVVDGFKKDQPILAVTTQVAEMSLDLSATLLVTQIANPAALIQRLGRLNRKYCGHALDAIFYPEQEKMERIPYTEDEFKAGLQLVRSFQGEVNQAQLAAWLEQLNIRGKPKKDSVLLDKKWRTYPASLREGGYTVTALLEQDEMKTSEIPRYTVPLPAKDLKNWKRHKSGYLIAPADQWGYSSELGAYEINKRGKV